MQTEVSSRRRLSVIFKYPLYQVGIQIIISRIIKDVLLFLNINENLADEL